MHDLPVSVEIILYRYRFPSVMCDTGFSDSLGLFFFIISWEKCAFFNGLELGTMTQKNWCNRGSSAGAKTHNGNWSQWSATCSEIKNIVSDQNCTTRSPIAKWSRSDTGIFSLYKYFSDLVASLFVESCKSCFHFPAMWLVSLNKPWNLIGCCILVKILHWLGKDAIQNSRINRISESRSDYKEHQWFQKCMW